MSIKNANFNIKNIFLLIKKLNKKKQDFLHFIKVLKSETCKDFETREYKIKYSTLWKMTGDEAIKRNHNIAV